MQIAIRKFEKKDIPNKELIIAILKKYDMINIG